MKSLHDLHDTTLTRIDLDWADGTLCVNLLNDYSHEVIRVFGKNLTSFSYERKLPWGKSVCVNKVEINQGSDGAVLIIKMQSGDIISGNGASFTISESSGTQ